MFNITYRNVGTASPFHSAGLGNVIIASSVPNCDVEFLKLDPRFKNDWTGGELGQKLVMVSVAWRAVPKDLSRICCFIHERIVSKDNIVQWDGRRFQIPPQPKRFSFAG